ncbi:CCR4-NOT transcription complex subunit 7-like [Physella acuta]|uniref:CCR4-NOT transcription complex subunit 7-like n=1 Tax=Physella acuta TaxID=109671 RepID=UPI0027DC95A1|nr:CCR4-NOT transcription complex subunit 7-like [Physella acuta]
MPAVLEDHGIRDVWASNMEEELRNISRVVKTHRYIAMDTEFPGVVARPIGEFRSTQEYTYHQMKCNVNLLKIIQIGFTFFDEDGNRAQPISTWQFNFKFCLGDDMYAQESIELLRKSGIQFERHERDGMDPFDFAAELIGAGVVLQPNVFLSFHSGYDFGYFIKMLQNSDLEEDDEEFFSKLRLHCPDIYDVKYLMKSCKDLKGGLQEVSDYLQIKRVGPQHQAGSDSLLTGMAFFKMRELYFENNIEREKYSGHLYGLGPFAASAANVTNGSGYGEYDTTADNGSQGTNS